jgi:hypothetical protein
MNTSMWESIPPGQVLDEWRGQSVTPRRDCALCVDRNYAHLVHGLEATTNVLVRFGEQHDYDSP